MVLVVGGEGRGMIEESGQEEGWQQVFFFSVRKRLSGVAVGVEVLHGPCRGGGEVNGDVGLMQGWLNKRFQHGILGCERWPSEGGGRRGDSLWLCGCVRE